MRLALLVVSIIITVTAQFPKTNNSSSNTSIGQRAADFFALVRARVASVVEADSHSGSSHPHLKALLPDLMPAYSGLCRFQSCDSALQSILHAQDADARLETRRLLGLRFVLRKLSEARTNRRQFHLGRRKSITTAPREYGAQAGGPWA